jgi:quercetin dioxygenase-like cupin family protein
MLSEVRRVLLEQRPVEGAPGMEMQLWLIEYPPGSTAASHRHPAVGVGYVVEGEFESAFEGQPLIRKRAGDGFVDEPKLEHHTFRVISEGPLRFVVAYTLPAGKAPIEY